MTRCLRRCGWRCPMDASLAVRKRWPKSQKRYGGDEPLHLLSRLPGGKGLLRAAYRQLAQRRYCGGRTCAVSGKGSGHSAGQSITSAFYEWP